MCYRTTGRTWWCRSSATLLLTFDSHEVAGVECRERGGFVWRKAKVRQAPLAALVHIGLQPRHGSVAVGDGAWRPGAGRQHRKGIKDLLVQSDRVEQCVVPPLDRGSKPVAQRWIQNRLMLKVGHAERHMPRLVLAREMGYTSGDRVGSVHLEEC